MDAAADEGSGTLVVGVDLGGTSTRAVLTDRAGSLLGQGKSAGGNLRSSLGDPATNLAEAVLGALGGRAVEEIAAIVIGAAGAAEARGAEVREVFAAGLAAIGVRPVPEVVPDTQIAFRSEVSGDGVLLLSGTGAIAVRFAGGSAVQRCDGLGWLLGDLGSGAWVGWEAVRAAAAELDGRGPQTALTAAVLEALAVEQVDDLRQGLIRAVDPLRGAGFARLAPLVVNNPDDPVAASILDRAAELLWQTAQTVGVGQGALVLAGGLLSVGGVRQRIEARAEAVGCGVRFAAHPVVGACAMAAEAAGVTLDSPVLRAALAS